jgi:hypothetical protein
MPIYKDTENFILPKQGVSLSPGVPMGYLPPPPNSSFKFSVNDVQQTYL